MTDLNCANNALSDVATLGTLTALTSLNLGFNKVRDISMLSGMKNLHSLAIAGNQIADLSCLASLAHLGSLDLRANRIETVAPLIESSARGSMRGFYIYVDGNPLSDSALFEEIPLLRQRNVLMKYAALDSLTDAEREFLRTGARVCRSAWFVPGNYYWTYGKKILAEVELNEGGSASVHLREGTRRGLGEHKMSFSNSNPGQGRPSG